MTETANKQLTADIKIAGKPYGKLTITRTSGKVLDVLYAKAGWAGAEQRFDLSVSQGSPERLVAFALLAKLGKDLALPPTPPSAQAQERGG